MDNPIKSSIVRFLEINSSFFLFGPTGIGKSTLVIKCLNELNIQYIKINCIRDFEISYISNSISRGLSELFPEVNLPKCKKIADIIENLEIISFFINDQEKKKSSTKKQIVFLIDNIDKLEKKEKILMKLFSLQRLNLFNIIIIAIGNSLGNFLKNNELSLIPKLNMEPPTQELINNILYEHFKNYLDKDYAKFVNNYASYFNIIANSDLNFLLTIGHKLLPLYISGENDLKKAKIILFNKPFISEIELKLDLNNEKIQNIKKITNLSKIDILVLISVYLGCINPESKDKILFKDYKKSQKRKNIKNEGVPKLKKVPFFRLIAIFQSLISLQDEFEFENNYFDQSLDLFKVINRLIDIGLISRVFSASKDFQINKAKFYCLADKSFIENIAKEIKINLEEFEFKAKI